MSPLPKSTAPCRIGSIGKPKNAVLADNDSGLSAPKAKAVSAAALDHFKKSRRVEMRLSFSLKSAFSSSDLKTLFTIFFLPIDYYSSFQRVPCSSFANALQHLPTAIFAHKKYVFVDKTGKRPFAGFSFSGKSLLNTATKFYSQKFAVWMQS